MSNNIYCLNKIVITIDIIILMEQFTLIKCVVVGDSGVGKSSLLLRYANNQFDEFSEPTLGAAFVSKMEMVRGKQIKFQIWDTAGQEKYKSIAPIYYKQSQVALCVYDISNKNSFLVMNKWVQELQNHGPQNMRIAVIGNKIDKTDTEQVSYQEGKQFAQGINAIFKLTSAKQGKGINEMFISIGQQILETKNNAVGNNNEDKAVNIGKDKNKKTKICCKQG